jgi:hypothetical protein
MTNLKMTLLENSTSFFEESLIKAVQAETEEGKWKFAILLLVQAIETSLKERLRRTQEILLYSNIDKPKNTVDLGLAIDRLQKISKVEFKNSDLTCIKTATTLRNQIVHFEFDLSIDQIKSNFVSLVGFYTSFCRDQLDTNIVNDLPEELHTELMNLDSYVLELEGRAEERIKSERIASDNILMCPACKKYTFVIEDGKDICYICTYAEAVMECERCSKSNFEDSLEDVDFGNMKGLENWVKLCSECVERTHNENEEAYEDYYR